MGMRLRLCANQNWKFCRNSAVGQRKENKNVCVWDVDYDDDGWETVTLPHTVRNEALHCSGGRNYQGFCWYRRRFSLPATCEGKTLSLEFEAAMQRVDAWLDGTPLGYREGGFLPIQFDLTGLSVETEHVLVLRVDNSDLPDVPPGKPQGMLDFCYFGGLYRDAWLHAAHPVHFTQAVFADRVASGGLFVHYRNVSAAAATVLVDAHFENRSSADETVSVRLLLNGETVSEGSALRLSAGGERQERISFTVSQPKLWHPRHPHLYTLTAQLVCGDTVVDELTERIGIREMSFTPNGFYINGEKLYLNGANRHQEYPYVGFAVPDAAQYRDARLLRDAGILCVRLGHYPQDKAFMDACDELGILCIIPTPGWQIHPASVKFDELSYENTRRMIRYNRNHPSTCLWEPILNETDYPEYFAKRQWEIVTEELGGDAVWAACDTRYAYSSHYSVVYNHSVPQPGRPRYVREYGDNWLEQFGPMVTMRRVHRSPNTGFYAGGELAMLRCAWERFEEYVLYKTDDVLCGAAMWAGIDHNRGYDLSEAPVGMLDFERLPKYLYELMKTQQEIGEVGPLCYIANDWTATSPRDVQVYTNAAAVRLFVNDEEIATLTAEESFADSVKYNERLNGKVLPATVHPPVVFKNVPWQQGMLRAEAIENGAVVATCCVRTPERAAKLELIPAWNGKESFTADGSDLLLVHARVVDTNGTVVKAAEPTVTFRAAGAAHIVGEGEPWVKANPAKAMAGVATVLLRADTAAGKITLTAHADGLEDGVLELETTPCELAMLPSPLCPTPDEKPTYECDKREFFSTRQNVRPNYNLDLALGKIATASSYKEGFPPENANQEKLQHPWIAGENTLPQWWQADLNKPTTVSGLTVKWYDDGVWYGYQVETSQDGETWETQASGQASGQSVQFVYFDQPVRTRFVRVTVSYVSGEEPVGIYKVEVFGERP